MGLLKTNQSLEISFHVVCNFVGPLNSKSYRWVTVKWGGLMLLAVSLFTNHPANGRRGMSELLCCSNSLFVIYRLLRLSFSTFLFAVFLCPWLKQSYLLAMVIQPYCPYTVTPTLSLAHFWVPFRSLTLSFTACIYIFTHTHTDNLRYAILTCSVDFFSSKLWWKNVVDYLFSLTEIINRSK